MRSEKKEAFFYGSIAVASAGALSLSSFMSVGNGERFKAMTLAAVSAMLVCGMAAYRQKLPERYIFYAILIAGAAMRTGYTIYTFPDVRQHDVWDVGETPGHFAYIEQLYRNGRLPDSYDGQFYHPPLSHAMTALFLRLVKLAGADPFQKEASWLQTVSCVLSCLIIVIIYRTAQEVKLGRRACLTAAALTAFHPAFYLLAASVNNDMAMVFFFFLGILYTVRYYNQPAMKNILILAAVIGCSMMSKLSGGMIALFTGPVFLAVTAEWIRQSGKEGGENGRKEEGCGRFSGLTAKKLACQFAAFLAVCAPLGLWHSVRNLTVLGQPPGFVPSPSVESDLYVGWRGLSERFLSFPLSHYFGSWCNPRGDYNLWTYMMKSALFGEWEFPVPRLLADGFLLLFLLLSAVSAVSMFCYARRKDVHPVLRWGLPLLTAVQLLLYLHFNIGYPFGCTMDFRYIVPVAAPFAIFAALAADWADQGESRWRKAASSVLYCMIGGFCTLSVLLYVI